MVPELERRLASVIRRAGDVRYDDQGKPIWARGEIQRMATEGIIPNVKSAMSTLEKWCDKGWYEFGVALDLGWWTDDAPTELTGSKPKSL